MKEDIIRLADLYAYDLDNSKNKQDELTAKRTFKEGIDNIFSLDGVSRSVLDFTPDNLSNIFKNIKYKPCKSPCYDYAWDVMDNGKFIGELFYSKEFREWDFIKDNYPSPRRAYKTSFPMDINSFIKIFKSINIELQLVV